MDDWQGNLHTFQPASATSAQPSGPVSGMTGVFQDSELVLQAQLGNHEAFHALFIGYNQQISKYLTRLVNNPEVACDLAQDAFLAAWQALPLMPAQVHFRPWLYKIATNKAVSWWRHNTQIRWTSWEEQANSDLAGSEFEEQLARTDLVQETLRTLPEVQRACLLLQSVGGFKIHEIAQILAMNSKTVSVYISRAREHFRQTYTRLQNEHRRTTKGEQN